MQPDHPDRPRFTLLAAMKLVAFCAVGCACLMPMLNLWRVGAVNGGTAQGLVSVAAFAAIVVPLAWAGLSFALIRRGAWRDRLILSLLLPPIAVALVLAVAFLFNYTIIAYGNPNVSPEDRVGLPFLALHLAAILALGAAALFLAMRLIRRAPSGGAARPRAAVRG